ncbi:MAG: hypothetical protein ACYDBQ_07885 [Thermoplasmatota archaeon]
MAAIDEPGSASARALGGLRIVLGLIFLWAFLDKLFGLTYSTPGAASWLAGGHPTAGYLSSSFGPLGSLFRGVAGSVVVDVLFMAGLGGVGISLTFGMGSRLGGWSGMAMVLLMYASHPVPWMTPHASHPFLDEHIVEAAALALVALTRAGEPLGFGKSWSRWAPGWLR